ncbi:hypothetical protein [Geofilum rhodophaeum]|uniref:hypothetical protein n=1 Tax=Geofilum rhodophaeum TaxID=1965019 RepID=UPI001314E110|nr:hypothetical protein [Geofilum rhodophaeum]
MEIDVAISLQTPTTGGEGDIGEGGLPASAAPKEPDYGPRSYQSPTSPFGDTSEPRY